MQIEDIMNPTFKEYMGDKKVFHPELKGQYEHLWKLYCTKMKSCYSKHSCTMFEAWRMAGNKTMDIGWDTKFICPFTSKSMKVATPFVGNYHWIPIEEEDNATSN